MVVLYRPNSEHARTVEEFVDTLKRRSGTADDKIEMVSLDTRDGSATASLYDVVQYPAILALQNDGRLLKDWQGSTMPLVNEVSSYTHEM